MSEIEGCLDQETVLDFARHSLPSAAMARAGRHVDQCAACRALVSAAIALGATLPTTPAGDGGDDARALGRGASVGRYLTLSLLGRGGMGEVYAAYDPELDRRVAVKLLRVAGGSEQAKKRLLREARALGKLSHPNVVQVYDVGEHGGDVFVAMELVEGESFDAWCRSTPAPRWQEVLAAYIAAARGLSAAHEKGIVHRDVKPSNLLRGRDGRVRVLDFGIASRGEDGAISTADTMPAASGEDRAVSIADTMPAASARTERPEDLTSTGMLLGTPLYMAPEQHTGARVGPASDQFGLCAALYEGVYGVPPFSTEAGHGLLVRLHQQKMRGAPAPPPGSAVPPWLHQVIARGLAPRPEDRYPTMDALVAALSDDPVARRRSAIRGFGIAAAVTALVTLAVAGWAKSGAFADPCGHPERDLAGVWDEGIKAQVKAAFLGTGRPYAQDTVTRVFALLDGQTTQWAAMRGQVCEATRRSGQRQDVLELRSVCLDRRRDQLRALTTLFAEKPDAPVLDKAVTATSALYPISYCADTEALIRRVRPPEDPAVRARVDAATLRVDRLEALYTAGKYQDGLDLAKLLLSEVAAIEYPPLRARVQYWTGLVQVAMSHFDEASALFEDAIRSAADGSDDVLAAHAWASLLQTVGERQEHHEEASVIRKWGQVAVARAHDDLAEAAWANAEGAFLGEIEDYKGELAAFERALAVRERALGPDHPDVAMALGNVGLALYDLGDYVRSRAPQERSVAILESALGRDHPSVATSLSNLGLALWCMGDYEAARAAQERALSIREAAFGPDHPLVAQSLDNLSLALASLGDYSRAQTLSERSVAIGESANASPAARAFSLAQLGGVLVRSHQLDAALPPLERAVDVLQRANSAPLNLATPLLFLGELRLQQKKVDEAVLLLERSLAGDNTRIEPEVKLALADALWSQGKDRPRALSLAEQVRAFYARVGHRHGLSTVDRWLAEHERDER